MPIPNTVLDVVKEKPIQNTLIKHMNKRNFEKPNLTKPTKKQERFFQHIKTAETLREAALKAGYSKASAINPKLLMEKKGFQALMEQYREDLVKAGFSTEMLAEIQMEGLFDQDAKVRLDYIKESKKDFGIYQPDNKPVNIAIGILPKKDYTW